MTASRNERLLVLGGLVAVVGLYLYQCWLYAGYVNDDAYITFRYSRFLTLGRGPYFNPGEHVEGYTNPLLMLLMAGVIGLGGAGIAPAAAKTIGMASGVATLVVTWAGARFVFARVPGLREKASLLGVAAAGIVAAHPSFALNSTSGLETTLFAFLVTTGLVLGIAEIDHRRWLGSGIAFGLACLTRPEGAYAFGAFTAGAVFVAFHRRRGGRMLVANAVIVATVLVAHAAARWILYDGEWLPNTFYAKAGGFWKLSAGDYVGRAILPTLLGWPGLAIALTGVAMGRGPTLLVGPLAAVGIAGIAFPFLVGADWMPGTRLVDPFLPSLVVMALLGWTSLAQRTLRLGPATVALLALALAPGVFAAATPYRSALAEYIRIRAIGYDLGHRALAIWLTDGRARPGDVIALMDIGIVGYQAIDQTILDITGLTDRRIARSEGEFLRKGFTTSYVLAREPRFIVIVFHKPGNPFERPPPEAAFDPWTDIEGRILLHPEFREHYVKPRPADAPSSWIDSFAARVGAVRAFPHLTPDRHYILAVFERQDGESRVSLSGEMTSSGRVAEPLR